MSEDDYGLGAWPGDKNSGFAKRGKLDRELQYLNCGNKGRKKQPDDDITRPKLNLSSGLRMIWTSIANSATDTIGPSAILRRILAYEKADFHNIGRIRYRSVLFVVIAARHHHIKSAAQRSRNKSRKAIATSPNSRRATAGRPLVSRIQI